MSSHVVLVTEVSASIYPTHGQWAVQVWSVIATWARLFWPPVGWSQEDIHYQDKGIWCGPDVCHHFGVWRCVWETLSHI